MMVLTGLMAQLEQQALMGKPELLEARELLERQEVREQLEQMVLQGLTELTE